MMAMPGMPVQNMPVQNMPVQNMPVQNMPMQNMPMQNMPMQNMPMQRQPMQPQMAQATQWQVPGPQATPSLGYLAGGVPSAPLKVRGVAPDPVPVPVPPPPKFVLASPEELGIATSLKLPVQTAAAAETVDWNQLHARLEKLGVLRSEKESIQGGVRVTLLLPMADPTKGQPVQAVAATEAAALAAALQCAEAWMQRR